jgi:hypothetical protein
MEYHPFLEGQGPNECPSHYLQKLSPKPTSMAPVISNTSPRYSAKCVQDDVSHSLRPQTPPVDAKPPYY